MQGLRNTGLDKSTTVHLGNAEAQHLHHAIPLHHDLRGFERMMDHFVTAGMIESLANLAGDVLQVPNGKAIFARESGRNRVALNVFGGGEQLAVFVADSIQSGNVMAAQRLCLFSLVKHAFEQGFAVVLLHLLKTNNLESYCLLGFCVQRLIDSRGRLRDLTDNFETPDYVGHFLSAPPQA